MCGIAGSYRFGADTTSIVTRMTEAQAHRGPDDHGAFQAGSVGFGHRRLAIIDRARGQQPITTDDARYTIIYNGQVYNYLELRDELEALGYEFHTASDTEVVLNAFAEWGTDSFDRLNGMFAIAIYDSTEDRLTLARDHFGIKPLYYWRDGDKVLFASEIKGLLASDQIERVPNDRVIYRYLRFRVQDDGTETFFAGINRLLGGQMMTVDASGVTISSYTDLQNELRALADGPQREYSPAVTAEYSKRLTDSVRARLQSEVPVGTSLSGGLDSSAVAAIIALALGEKADAAMAAVGPKQNTFSAVFPNSINDEERYVDAVLAKYEGRITAHKIKPDASQFLKDLHDFVRTQEEPIISTGPYAQYAVMREARNHVTVLLDGQGADEMMAGYNPYFYVYLRQLRRQGRYKELAREMAASRDIMAKLVKHKFFVGKTQPVGELLDADFQARFAGEKFSMTNDNLKVRLLEDTFRNSLPSLLRYEDKNTMRFSLEGRVPFIDKELLKFLFSLDDSAIIHEGWNKRILRDAMDGKLPKMIARRRNKIGFTTPEDEWFIRIKSDLYGIFASEEFASRPYFNAGAVTAAFESFIANPRKHETMVFWRLLNLELWLREFFDEPGEEIDESAPKSDYDANREKKLDLTSDVDGRTYARYPLQTELVAPDTDIPAFATMYVERFFANLPEGAFDDVDQWYLFISEKIVAIAQGRSYFIWDIKARPSARLLSRFVKRTPVGIGLGNPATMELAMREAGELRVIGAAAAGAVGKLLKKPGLFYTLAGSSVGAIDGPTEYSAYPSNVSAKLPPKDPEVVAQQLSAAVRAADIPADVLAKFRGTVVIDANDIGRDALGKDTPGSDETYEAMFADNPLGQERQLTPLAVVARKS